MSSFGKKISCTGQLSLFITLVNLFSFRTFLLMLNSCQNVHVHCIVYLFIVVATEKKSRKLLCFECCSLPLLYLSDSTRAVIGQFCGPYSTVRPAFRPAKFESLVQHSVANMSHQENF